MKKHYFDAFNFSKRFASVEEKIVAYCPSSDADCLLSEQKNTLIVLSWNVNKNNQSERWAKEFADIYVRYQPDIICLQEARLSALASSTDQPLAWSKPLQTLSSTAPIHAPIDAPIHASIHVPAQQMPLTRMSWCFAPNFEDAVEETYSGVLTLAAMPSTSSRGLLTAQTEPVTQTPKVSLLTEYDLMGRSLLVINTHLINFVSPLIFQTQLDQIEAAAIAHEGATILSGDFNTWSSGRLRRLKKMAARLGLSAAKFAPQDARHIKRFLASPSLDHIFCRGFKQNLLGAAVVSPVFSSDHRPLVIELSY